MTNRKILQRLIYILLLSPCLLIRTTNTAPKIDSTSFGASTKKYSVNIIKQAKACSDRIKRYAKDNHTLIASVASVVPIVGATIVCAATSGVTVPAIVMLCTTQTAVIGGFLGGAATFTTFHFTKNKLKKSINKYLKPY